jgi:hypothetical protein
MKRSTLLAFTIITCLSTTLLIIPPTTAATGWTRTYQGEPLEVLTPASVIQTSDGGYVIAGSAQSLTGSHQDIFLVKTENMEQPPELTPVPTSEQTPTSTPVQ